MGWAIYVVAVCFFSAGVLAGFIAARLIAKSSPENRSQDKTGFPAATGKPK